MLEYYGVLWFLLTGIQDAGEDCDTDGAKNPATALICGENGRIRDALLRLLDEMLPVAKTIVPVSQFAVAMAAVAAGIVLS